MRSYANRVWLLLLSNKVIESSSRAVLKRFASLNDVFVDLCLTVVFSVLVVVIVVHVVVVFVVVWFKEHRALGRTDCSCWNAFRNRFTFDYDEKTIRFQLFEEKLQTFLVRLIWLSLFEFSIIWLIVDCSRRSRTTWHCIVELIYLAIGVRFELLRRVLAAIVINSV